MKAATVYDAQDHVIGYLVRSPATGADVCFYADRWTFNGDMEKPTFSPSMVVKADPAGHFAYEHFFVRDGKIEYLSDCDHPLAGKTVDMVDISDT